MEQITQRSVLWMRRMQGELKQKNSANFTVLQGSGGHGVASANAWRVQSIWKIEQGSIWESFMRGMCRAFCWPGPLYVPGLCICIPLPLQRVQ